MTGFFITYFLLRNHLNNHALWISFLFYLFTRGIVQHIIYKKLFAKKL
jgi:MATE family multidrug resistance protein